MSANRQENIFLKYSNWLSFYLRKTFWVTEIEEIKTSLRFAVNSYQAGILRIVVESMLCFYDEMLNVLNGTASPPAWGF